MRKHMKGLNVVVSRGSSVISLVVPKAKSLTVGELIVLPVRKSLLDINLDLSPCTFYLVIQILLGLYGTSLLA